MKRLTSIILGLVLSTQVFAFDLSGGSTNLQMLQQLIAIKKQLHDQVKQLKEQKALVDDVRELAAMREQAQRAIRNNDLLGLLDNIEDTLNSIANSPSEQADQLQKTIDKLTGLLQTASPNEKPLLEKKIRVLKQKKMLAHMAENSSENMKRASTNLAETEAVKLTAESTATLARIAIEEQEARANAEHAKLDEQQTVVDMIEGQSAAMEALSKTKPKENLFGGE